MASALMHPIQQRFLEDHPSRPDHYNISMLLTVQREVPVNIIRRSLQILVERHQVLRRRYPFDSESVVPVEPEHAFPLDLIHLSEGSETALQAELASKCDDAQKSLSITNGPMCRAVHFEAANGMKYLLLIVHHMAADAMAFRILLREFQIICRTLAGGGSATSSSLATDHGNYVDSLHEKINNSGSSDLKWWVSRPWSEVSQLSAGNPAGSLHVRHFQKFDTWLDESTSEHFSRFRSHAGWTSEETLLTAVAHALAEYSDTATVGIEVLRHGRVAVQPEQKVLQTVGWIGSFAPYVLEIPDSGGPTDGTVTQIRDTQARETSWGALRYLHDDPAVRARLAGFPRPEMRFNFRGNALDLSRLIAPPFAWAKNHIPVSLTPDHFQSHGLKVHADLIGGRLRTSWLYSAKRYDPEAIERLADRTYHYVRQVLGGRYI
ncbi:condensation domain-containing protein [Streptomyces sp. NPDC058665]|uniref:condensation domain-containing protein n=1 Tax=Streptomyces sp. NPDC058665 TaxID=3346586 RepID=UPI00366926E1